MLKNSKKSIKQAKLNIYILQLYQKLNNDSSCSSNAPKKPLQHL